MRINNEKPKSSLKDKLLVTLFSIIITASVLCVVGVFLLNTSFFDKSNNVGGENVNDKINSEITTPVDVKEKQVTFLIAGIDYVEGSNRGKLTDMIMVANFDIKGKLINILRIPRDTYIGQDYTESGKINEVYGRKEGGGIQGLANVINKNFALTIDHYATIDMDGFKSIVDAMGGVEVDVPQSFTLEGVTIEKGLQTLSGFTAEKFVRERKAYKTGDLMRIEMQNLFLKAMVEKMFTLGMKDVTKLATKVITYVTSDMTLGEMLGYYKKVTEVDRNSGINFYTVPILSAMNNGHSVLSIKRYETGDLLNSYFRPYSPKVDAEDLALIELEVTSRETTQ